LFVICEQPFAGMTTLQSAGFTHLANGLGRLQPESALVFAKAVTKLGREKFRCNESPHRLDSGKTSHIRSPQHERFGSELKEAIAG